MKLFLLALLSTSAFAGDCRDTGCPEGFSCTIFWASRYACVRDASVKPECENDATGDCSCIAQCGRLCSQRPVFCGRW